MDRNKKLAFSTRAVHSGYQSSENQGSLNPPIYMTSTFCFDTVEQGAARFSGEESGHFYSRISNPTQAVLETRLADLEDGEAALATASGMGAISATFWTIVSPGDHVLVDKTVYGCTFSFMEHGLKKFGIEVTYVDFTKHDEINAALQSNTRVVYFESPVNPSMRILDIHQISILVKDYSNDIQIVVDNTYCTPALQRPLTMGADIVVHSATKYLGGHGDLIAGAVVGRTNMIENIRLHGLKDMTGAVISPINVFLVLRGIKTLQLRMERHCQNAQIVAEMLEAHSAVESTYYPGLPSDSGHQLAKRQMDGFGGMIAFELKAGFRGAVKTLNALQLIKRAVSLGDAETLIQHPASMTHSTYSPEQQEMHGITQGLIRISVGLECVDDILADLNQALGA
tara:strand:- start:3235 stop:4428 length:1194 start_codon:yes stop_codon:yes gene_type:complete